LNEIAVSAEFPTNTHDLDIHRTIGGRIVIAFNRADYLMSTINPTRMSCEQVENLKLGQGEIHTAIAGPNQEPDRVNKDFAGVDY
jgi:hypothetical protein